MKFNGEYDFSSTKHKICEYRKGDYEKRALWYEWPIHDDITLKVIGEVHSNVNLLEVRK